jgi:hypothetical protein
MTGILNISSSGAPLYINTNNLTAILSAPKSPVPLVICNAQGQSGSFKPDDNTTYDAAGLAVRMTADGAPMVEMPLRYSNNGELYAHYYISPDAVYFATVSKPNENGRLDIIMGVEGVGRVEIYNAEPQEFSRLINAVQSRKQMTDYPAEEASARLCHPDRLYIDAKKIQRMQNCYNEQVDIFFTGGDRLDVQLPAPAKVNVKNYLPSDANIYIDDVSLTNAFDKARAQNKLNEETALQNKLTFMDDLAVRHGNMVSLPMTNANRAIYINKDFFTKVSFLLPYERNQDKNDNDFYLKMSPHGGRYDDSVTVSFKTAEERDAFISDLNRPAAFKPKKTGVPKP